MKTYLTVLISATASVGAVTLHRRYAYAKIRSTNRVKQAVCRRGRTIWDGSGGDKTKMHHPARSGRKSERPQKSSLPLLAEQSLNLCGCDLCRSLCAKRTSAVADDIEIKATGGKMQQLDTSETGVHAGAPVRSVRVFPAPQPIGGAHVQPTEKRLTRYTPLFPLNKREAALYDEYLV